MVKRTNNKKTIKSPKKSIIIKDHISLSVLHKQEYSFKYLARILTAFFGCFGAIYSFISLFSFKFYEFGLFFYASLFFTFFVTVFLLPKKFLLTLIPTLLIYLTLIKKNWYTYINGFQLVVNRIYNEINETSIGYYRVSTRISQSECITTFFIFSSFLLIMLICYFVITRPNLPICFLITFPLLEIGLYYGITPKYIFTFMLISFWIAVLVLQNSSYNEYANNTDANFLRKENNFYSKPNIKLKVDGLSTVWAFSIALSILILSNVVINVVEFKRPQTIDNLRSNIKNSIEEFSVDNVQESIEKIKSAFKNEYSENIYEQQLGQQGFLKYNNVTDLIVEVSFNPHEALYLKSFVGGIYTGYSWSIIPQNEYEKNLSLFEKMKKSGYYPQDFLLYNKVEFVNPFYTNTIKITVNNKNQNLNFVPYYVLNKNDKFTYINDTTIALENKQEYTFTFKSMESSYGVLDDFNNYFRVNNFTDIHTIESSYRDFVYNNYTQLPENFSINEVYENYSFIFEDNYSPEVTLDKIKTALAKDAKYTLSPGKTPKNKDFVSYFLLENNKGYCTHFASAGAVLARMAGIPTRYVTGYIIPKSEFNLSNKNIDASYKINVKDKYAHAWVEVYIDDVGWVPYEFTPGYSNGDTPEETERETSTTRKTTTTKATEPKATTKTTTKPGTSEAQKSLTSNTESISSTPQKNVFRNSVVITIITIISFVILSLSFIILKRKYVLLKMIQALKSDNNNSNVINLYLYITKILAFIGIENSNMQYFEFADYVEKHSSLLQKGEMQTIIEYVLKASLSEHTCTKEEVDFILTIAKRIVYDVYNQQPLPKKLEMKYRLNLL